MGTTCTRSAPFSGLDKERPLLRRSTWSFCVVVSAYSFSDEGSRRSYTASISPAESRCTRRGGEEDELDVVGSKESVRVSEEDARFTGTETKLYFIIFLRLASV
uniref:Uncharacterized protein n=1 Tax=Steinernema glaseri TaxID=37863 RepID=A0A1I7Y1C7_9BILA